MEKLFHTSQRLNDPKYGTVWGDKWVGQTVDFRHLLGLPLVGAGTRTLTTVWRKRQETGLGGGRCLGGTFEVLSRMSWSPLLYLYTHTPWCTGSTVLPPSSRKCAVPCYDRWLAFRDRAAPTVCLFLLRMAAE